MLKMIYHRATDSFTLRFAGGEEYRIGMPELRGQSYQSLQTLDPSANEHHRWLLATCQTLTRVREHLANLHQKQLQDSGLELTPNFSVSEGVKEGLSGGQLSLRLGCVGCAVTNQSRETAATRILKGFAR